MSNGEIRRLDNNCLVSVLYSIAFQSSHLFLYSPLSAWFYSNVKMKLQKIYTDTVLCAESKKLHPARDIFMQVTGQAGPRSLPNNVGFLRYSWQSTYREPYFWRHTLLTMCFGCRTEKLTLHWLGNVLLAGYLSWCQKKMLRSLLDREDITDLTQCWILHLEILTFQAICACWCNRVHQHGGMTS